MVSLGILPALASLIALRRRALASGSPPPLRAATVISLINFVNSLPRLASSAPFLCLILCHFECPDICSRSFWRVDARAENISQEKAIHRFHRLLCGGCGWLDPISVARILSSPRRRRADRDRRPSIRRRNPGKTCARRQYRR